MYATAKTRILDGRSIWSNTGFLCISSRMKCMMQTTFAVPSSASLPRFSSYVRDVEGYRNGRKTSMGCCNLSTSRSDQKLYTCVFVMRSGSASGIILCFPGDCGSGKPLLTSEMQRAERICMMHTHSKSTSDAACVGMKLSGINPQRVSMVS